MACFFVPPSECNLSASNCNDYETFSHQLVVFIGCSNGKFRVSLGALSLLRQQFPYLLSKQQFWNLKNSSRLYKEKLVWDDQF